MYHWTIPLHMGILRNEAVFPVNVWPQPTESPPGGPMIVVFPSFQAPEGSRVAWPSGGHPMRRLSKDRRQPFASLCGEKPQVHGRRDLGQPNGPSSGGSSRKNLKPPGEPDPCLRGRGQLFVSPT